MFRLFSDQVTQLADQFPESSSSKAVRLQKLAIGSAYRNLGGVHPWSYLRRRTQINTVAPYGTGTIAYTASTRIVTLTDGTWPTWAASGTLVIDSVLYKVESRDSSTQLTLVSDRCPVDNIASGTAYEIYRSEYLLPADFMRMEDIAEIGRAWDMEYIPPEEILNWARTLYNPTRPWRYTIRGAQYGPRSRMAVEFIPPPSSAQTFDVVYEAKPRARTLTAAYSTGTIAISGSTVTGTGTAFTEAMEGCVLRVGSGNEIPTDENGDNPFVAEYEILSYTSATVLTLTTTATTVTGVKFLIDDPVDVDMGPMLSYFDAACKAEYMRSNNLEGADKAYQMSIEMLKMAMGMDHRTNLRDTTPSHGLDLYQAAVSPHFAPVG